MLLAIRGIAVLKFFVALAIGYKTLAGVTWFQAFQWLVSLVPTPKSAKDWNDDELQQWWNKAQGEH